MKKFGGMWVGMALMASSFMMAPVAQVQADQSTPSTTTSATTFRWGINPPDSMNPFIAVNESSIFIHRLAYESLVDYDQNFNYVPYLATSWSTSKNGLVWTFHLTDKSKWQDGQPLTAKDVKFSIDYINKNQLGLYYAYVQDVKSVSAPDDKTVVITLDKPLSIMLYNMRNLIILPEHIWSHISKAKALSTPNMPIIGSGPFKFVTWKKGQYVQMNAVKNYWRGNPKIKELVLEEISNPEVAVNELKAGQLDGVNQVPPALAKSLQKQSGLSVVGMKSFWFDDFIINSHLKGSKGNPLLHDRAVQLAIAHSINKKALVNSVFFGRATPGVSIIAPANKKWFDSHIHQFDFNTAEARKILTNAGYKMGSDGIFAKNGKELKFRLNVMQDPAAFRSAQQIAAWLKQSGISVTPIETQDLQSLINNHYNYDLMMWDWSGYPDPDFNLMTLTTVQIGNWQDAGYSNSTYDKLYTQQQETMSYAKRKAMVDQMQSTVYNDLPYVVLYYPDRIQAYNSAKWTGLVPMTDGFFSELNIHSALNVQPVVAPAAVPTTSSNKTWIWVGAAALIIVVGGALIVLRRRSQDAD